LSGVASRSGSARAVESRPAAAKSVCMIGAIVDVDGMTVLLRDANGFVLGNVCLVIDR